MAEKRESSERELTTCSVCSKEFREPKLLSCLDTFCCKCLEELICHQSQARESVICPTCGSLTTIPDNGLKGLPDNSFAAMLIQIKKLNEDQKNQQLACSACSRHSTATTELAVAVVFCVVCEDKLCNACADAHRKLRITTDHRLVQLDQDLMTKLSEARQSKQTCCQEHSDQACTLFCRDTECYKPICLKCAVLTHKTHEYTDITVVAKDRRKDLLKVAEALGGRLASLMQQSRILERRKNLLKESTNKVETLVDLQRDSVLSIIENGRRDLNTLAQDICDKNMATLQEAEVALNTKLTDLHTAMAFGQVLCKKGNDVEISCLLQQFQLKADRVRTHQSHDLPEKLDLQLQFTVDGNTSNILNKTTVCLGSVTVTDDVSTEDTTGNIKTHLMDTAEPKQQQSTPELPESAVHAKDDDSKRHDVGKSLRFVGKIKGMNPVRGIAVIGAQLFVVHRSASSIDVYNSDSLASVGKLDVTGLVNPTDMAACSTTKRIFVSDSTKVFRVRLLSGNKRNVDVLTFKMQPFGLSVASNSHVFVAHPKDECFAEYNDIDFCLIRTVETPGLKPFHVVLLANDSFVICGGSLSNFLAVCNLDESQKSHTGNAVAVCKREMTIFKQPTHVAVDAKGLILVVDSHQHRVVITDRKLSKALCTYRDEYTTGLYKFCLSSDASIISSTWVSSTV